MEKKSVIFDEAARRFLYEYLNNPSPTSHEAKGQQIWLNYLQRYTQKQHCDAYGTAYGIINPDSDYKVVIEAHADEISWMVHYISDNGLIYVLRNGGMDHQIAPSKRVFIHTSKGKVEGVFGWPAIHLRDAAKEESPKVSNLTIDCGCDSRQEVEDLGVHIGCVVTYQDELTELNGGRYFCGRAVDNRIGGFMIAQVARLLHENKIKLPYSLYIVNSVQEEVGLRGAQMIAQYLQPDVALVTDVAHDTTTPMISKTEKGDFACGKGTMLAYAPAVHNKLLNLIIETAQEQNLPFQREAVSRSTGTDTDAIAYSGKGVVSALLSLPLRYMHTTVEMAHRDDIENTIQLMYYTLLKIQYRHDFKYF